MDERRWMITGESKVPSKVVQTKCYPELYGQCAIQSGTEKLPSGLQTLAHMDKVPYRLWIPGWNGRSAIQSSADKVPSRVVRTKCRFDNSTPVTFGRKTLSSERKKLFDDEKERKYKSLVLVLPRTKVRSGNLELGRNRQR